MIDTPSKHEKQLIEELKKSLNLELYAKLYKQQVLELEL